MRAEARERFGLTDAPTVLVTGGSLGAQRLNDAFAGAVADLSSAGVQVLHVTGTGKAFAAGAGTPGRPTSSSSTATGWTSPTPRPTSSSRARAPTPCASSPPWGCPRVYVPLPIGNGEQRLNARAVIAAGGGLLVEDAAVDAAWVRSSVVPLATDASRLASMAAASASVGRARR